MRQNWHASVSFRSPLERPVRFKLDENLPELVRESLSGSGHDAHTVAEEGLSGARDESVLRGCVIEDRVLITLDLDFSDIRAYPPGSYPGIWVLRPTKQTFKAIDALVRADVRLSTVERVRGQLWIIDEKRVRIRDGDA
jgi:predicted nuclease of predicted toxin-antitoxin system